jgi:hypothetical protein
MSYLCRYYYFLLFFYDAIAVVVSAFNSQLFFDSNPPDSDAAGFSTHKQSDLLTLVRFRTHPDVISSSCFLR